MAMTDGELMSIEGGDCDCGKCRICINHKKQLKLNRKE
jgi:hypothetical protein